MRIAVLVSGGVDSAVALRLLADAGHEVEAFYLKVWLADEMAHLGDCPWEDDLRSARAVCDPLSVPLHVVPLQQAYHRHVVSAVLEELAAGRTPSPDIGCNRHVKFGAFLSELDAMDRGSGRGFDRVATGHYARLEHHDDGVRLLRGIDRVKDQTYFLYRLDQARLRRLVFPLGASTKPEVRALATDFDLPNRARPDSQGICFLGGVRYRDFVEASLGEKPGPIRDIDGGGRLGRHRGLWFHTVGQRRGLGLGGGPWYVVEKAVASDTLWVAHADRYSGIERRRFRIESPFWIAGTPPRSLVTGDTTARLGVKVRHAPVAAPATVRGRTDGTLEVMLDGDDTGLADGQPAVLYDGEVCLGGGPLRVEAGPRESSGATSSSDTASSR